MIRSTVLGLALLSTIACEEQPQPSAALTREQLLDPTSCKPCHEQHYLEWSSSMHAYASKDPVFLAMNKRGQEEANLQDFCVKCHAPMAVYEKAITDFGDLSSLPEHLQGVTCYFCHNAVGIGEPHANGNLLLANDRIMRGALTNPVSPGAHEVAPQKSIWHDSERIESSRLCGTCHDIVTPNGTHLERTLQEYEASLFASSDPMQFQSCQDCHMRTFKMSAAPGFEGSPQRTTHSHLWPGVDVALTPFPNQEALRSAVEKCELQNSINYFEVLEGDAQGNPSFPDEPYTFTVVMESDAGHAMPSGATQDRRMWLEVIARNAAGEVIFSSGTIGDDEVEEDPSGPLCLFRDIFLDAEGKEAHMFWDAVGEPAVGSRLIPIKKSAVAGAHVATCTYTMVNAPRQPPAKLELRMRMRPMGLPVLQDLIDSGHLDPAIRAAMPTFTVFEKEVVYDPTAESRFPETRSHSFDCGTFECLLDANSPKCLANR